METLKTLKSLIIIKRKQAVKKNKLTNITVGNILKEEFMEPMGVSNYQLAKATKTTPTHIGQIVNGKRSISVDMAIRLGKYFKNGPEIWLNIQTEYNIRKEKNAHKKLYQAIKPASHLLCESS